MPARSGSRVGVRRGREIWSPRQQLAPSGLAAVPRSAPQQRAQGGGQWDARRTPAEEETGLDWAVNRGNRKEYAASRLRVREIGSRELLRCPDGLEAAGRSSTRDLLLRSITTERPPAPASASGPVWRWWALARDRGRCTSGCTSGGHTMPGARDQPPLSYPSTGAYFPLIPTVSVRIRLIPVSHAAALDRPTRACDSSA